MTDYGKKTKVRVQVMLDQARHDQIAKLAELTDSSISRIVRLALDSKSDEFDQAIAQVCGNANQIDLYRSSPEPVPAPKKTRKKAPRGKRRIGEKPITNESFAKLIDKQKKR